MRRANVVPLFGELPAPPIAPMAPVLRAASAQVERIFAAWREVLGHERARLDAVRRRVIEARLADGYSEAELVLAFYGCRFSAFHQGDNKHGQVYDSITLILRDADHVERFMAIAQHVGDRMQAQAQREAAQQQAAAAEPAGPCSPDSPGYRAFLERAARMGVKVRGGAR